jgi:polyisoprenoid-binding protein YceI
MPCAQVCGNTPARGRCRSASHVATCTAPEARVRGPILALAAPRVVHSLRSAPHMTAKLLQVAGIVAVLALVAGSFAALAVVKQRVHVTVADEEAAARRGPDPVELLRADVGELRGDVAGLSEGLGTQLQALHDALDGAAREREASLEASVAQLQRELQVLRTQLEQSETHSAAWRNAVGESLARMSRELNELTAAVRDSARIEAPAAVAIEPPPAPEVAPVAVAPAEPEPALEAPAAPEAPKKTFLSFKLPSQSLRFDQPQRFSVIPSLSRVGFDAKSTLHDFSGVTQKIEGELIVNLSAPGVGSQGSLRVEATSLDTGLADRDAQMRSVLDVAKFAQITFEWTAFDVAASDAAALTVSGTARGKLTIKGKARDVAMPVRVSVDASKRLTIDGEMRIKLSDFGVAPPSKLGVISVDDEIKLWIALRARSLGPVEAAPRD